ncbi:MAG TPA: glycosyltransferase family 4 protein [Methylomirabilota bacterium]|nr:glycosyltransferase family 4 protein [Methylomirabilota bacterium]
MTSRVLFLDAGLGLGGAEHSLLLLLGGLRRSGVHATVAVLGSGPFQRRLAELGIPTVELPLPSTLRRASRYRSGSVTRPWVAAASTIGALRIAALCRRLGVDLVHTNGLKMHVLGGVAGRLARTPVIWHLRDFPPPGFAGRLIRSSATRLASLVLTNSDAVAASIGGGDRIRRVYNPIDVDRFHPGVSGKRVREELDLGDAPVVAMVAHLTPWKGHEQFLMIAREVVAALPAARFLVAGGAIYETAGHQGYAAGLRARAEVLGVDRRVHFLGERDDVPEILAAADVLVHCSIAPEPFGRVLAEAMAVGRPVVASRAGGIPEVVEDGQMGYLVPVGDVPTAARAVLRLLGSRELREAFGAAGRRRAVTRFAPAAHTAGVLDAYRIVLERA